MNVTMELARPPCQGMIVGSDDRMGGARVGVRVLDNGIYILFSGLVGAPSDFIGSSAIFDPLGRRIAHVAGGEGIALADIDPGVIAATRDQQRMWFDRRESLGHRQFKLLTTD